MKSVLITGCNRGIGLSLVSNLLKRSEPPKYVIATCRSREKSEKLNELAKQHSNLHIFEIDLTNFNQYDNLIKQVDDIVKENGVNLLINNAGVTTKFTRINQVKVEQMTQNFVVNTIAPLMFTKACIPLLKKTASQSGNLFPTTVVNISSILGSISSNTDGGFYPYRASKAALNACTKSLSLDLKGDKIRVTSLHPGWCKTDMGGKNAPLEVDDAVVQILNTIEKLTDKDNGGFIQYDGQTLPW